MAKDGADPVLLELSSVTVTRKGELDVAGW